MAITRHLSCGKCFPVLDGPHQVFTGLCGVPASHNPEAPTCPDCLAVIEVLRQCPVCRANIWFGYEEEIV